jgi:SecD/SecF fusion protein
MQGKGFRIAAVVFFLGLAIWYLYPSVQSYMITRQMNALDGEARDVYQQENHNRIRSVQERALKLGLDLQGGMHVALEVRTDALISELAVDKDDTFEEVLQAARERVRSGDQSIIDSFVDEFESRDPEARLSRYFRNPDRNITRRSTNGEIRTYLREQADAAVDRAIEIVRQRVDRFGVSEPSIQKQGTRRIIVELPGVDDPERVRNLLRGTARLEFRLMADPNDLRTSLQNIIEYYEGRDEPTALPEPSGDGQPIALADGDPIVAPAAPLDEDLVQGDTLLAEGTTDADTLADDATVVDDPMSLEFDAAQNPLLARMQPVGQGVVFGAVSVRDSAAVNAMLADPAVARMLPSGIQLMYEANPIGRDEQGFDVYYMLAVRDQIELTGDVITDARVDFDEVNRPEVTMVMNAEGARQWARITGANINRNVAVVLDGVVYSYPTVITRIVGGRSSITGLASRNEAQDVVTILMSGALPAPVDIVEERTVGPSLGAASIRAGFISVVVGLMLVALFMIFYYRTAGVVANLALLLNIVFILGILAAFCATLTLPGIAGIVLTIGMAVDANVLIFDRIREEGNTGKTLKAAMESGYSKAYSAIFDANITTFFVAAILYSFGVGPIQGFAVTLMAGILSSLFTAIVVTRIVFDYMVIDKRMAISYG